MFLLPFNRFYMFFLSCFAYYFVWRLSYFQKLQVRFVHSLCWAWKVFAFYSFEKWFFYPSNFVMGDFFQRRGKTGRSRLINEEDNQDSESGPGQHSVSYGATTRIRGMQSMLFTFAFLSSVTLGVEWVKANGKFLFSRKGG